MTNEFGTRQGSLQVSLADESSSLITRRLPFEVRDAHSVVVKRGILGKPVELDPGSYSVSAVAADGRVLTAPAAVVVEADAIAKAELQTTSLSFEYGRERPGAVSVDAPSKSGRLATQVQEQITGLEQQSPSLFKWLLSTGVGWLAGFIGRQVPGFAQLTNKIDLDWLQQVLSVQLKRIADSNSTDNIIQSLRNPSGPNANLVLMTGMTGSLNPDLRPAPSAAPAVRLGAMTLLLERLEGRFIDVQGDADDHLVVAMPCDGANYTVATCFRQAANLDPYEPDAPAPKKLAIDFFFSDPDTNTLFQYMAYGALPQAGELAAAIADHDAADTSTAPAKLAMVFAAYVLLRKNQLDGLDRLGERLYREWPRSPDVAAIRMEIFARQGRHEKAVRLCVDGAPLGLPVIASGIAYQQQRIRRYLDTAARDPEGTSKDGLFIAPEHIDTLRKNWITLAPIGARLDSRTIVTAFPILPPEANQG